MKLKNIKLPSRITEESWFYKDSQYTEQIKPFLGWQYVSYSTAGDVTQYFEDTIKQKIAGLDTYKDTCYTLLGNYLGEAIETGKFSENNPEGFVVDSSLDLSRYRPDGAEYEKLVTLILSEEEKVVFIGFIDVCHDKNGKKRLRDNKSGSSTKVKDYTLDKYIQLVLYAYALEQKGENIDSIGVDFFERIGSHLNKPLKLTGKHTDISLEYNKDRIDFALKKIYENTQYISDLYTTYLKIFGDGN